TCSARLSICDVERAGDDRAELAFSLPPWNVELRVTVDVTFEPSENLRALSPSEEENDAAAPEKSICCQASRSGLSVELRNSRDCSMVRTKFAGDPLDARCCDVEREAGVDRAG
ncbi:unnamed protein product, partial [Ixodes hexagonus]